MCAAVKGAGILTTVKFLWVPQQHILLQEWKKCELPTEHIAAVADDRFDMCRHWVELHPNFSCEFRSKQVLLLETERSNLVKASINSMLPNVFQLATHLYWQFLYEADWRYCGKTTTKKFKIREAILATSHSTGVDVKLKSIDLNWSDYHHEKVSQKIFVVKHKRQAGFSWNFAVAESRTPVFMVKIGISLPERGLDQVRHIIYANNTEKKLYNVWDYSKSNRTACLKTFINKNFFRKHFDTDSAQQTYSLIFLLNAVTSVSR